MVANAIMARGLQAQLQMQFMVLHNLAHVLGPLRVHAHRHLHLQRRDKHGAAAAHAGSVGCTCMLSTSLGP
jgi:hypothetical protein